MFPSGGLSDAKNILTAHHIGNIFLSVAFFIVKITPGVCNVIFAMEEECGLDRREHEIMVFLGVIILWKNRKASNWLHYLANVFLFSKMANVFLFLRAEPLIGSIYVLLCIAGLKIRYVTTLTLMLYLASDCCLIDTFAFTCVFAVHAVLFPEPAYTGPEKITYFNGTELYDEVQRNKRVTWLVQFYTTWSPECKHIAPVFAQLSDRFALPNLRFAKFDVGRWPKEAERFRINTHPASRQLPTISLFKDGKEVLRRPTIQNKRAIPFVFTQENCILEFDINNLYNECKSNLNKHGKEILKKDHGDERTE
ncbi:unnamed protein product [Toxocara canis]|uniref:Thioredoxin domain-containing protein n=1 Tax=Toxocara canis TaxID=6265 RepID=A0A183UAK1_TOXCA|nr:unnamed protein product [Toxocara canis]